MKLTNEVYLVGGGDYAFNISHPKDSHVYVLKSDEELAIIDPGFDGLDDVFATMRADGLDPGKVSHIFVTHYHADHVGALAPARKATGAKAVVGREGAEVVRIADPGPTGLAWAQSFEFYPPEFEWQPSEVDVDMKDGDRFKIGSLEVEAIYTPGHCEGHYCFRVVGERTTYLFTGDHLFWGGEIILQNVVDASIQAYAASMNKLLEVEFEALLPGHSALSLRNGKRHALMAANDFNRIGLPKNML